VSDTGGIITKKIKPNFKLLGAKMGKKMKQVGQAISELSQKDISLLEKNGNIDLSVRTPSENVENETVNILKEEVEIISEDIAGWLVTNKGDLTVALDITITEILKEEGVAREFVSSIQKFRKESNFNVTHRIKLTVKKDEQINNAIIKFKVYICSEILAEDIQLVDELSNGTIIELNEQPILITVFKKN